MPRAQLINCRFTKNLIVAPSGKPLFSFPEYAAGDTTNVIIDDNWYWGSTSGRLGTNYKYGDPQFVDPANGNFNLLADSPAQGYGAFQSMEDDSVSNFTLTVDGTIVSDPLAFKVYSDSSLTNELTALHLGDIRRNQNYTKDFWVKNMSADASGFVTPILSGDIVNKITSAFAPASQTIQPGASQKFTLTYSVKTGAADGGFSGTLSG